MCSSVRSVNSDVYACYDPHLFMLLPMQEDLEKLHQLTPRMMCTGGRTELGEVEGSALQLVR